MQGLQPGRITLMLRAYDGSNNGSAPASLSLDFQWRPLPGDCDGDYGVSIGEAQRAINMFLAMVPPACGADCDGDGSVSIGEVQRVVNAFLGLASRCP